MSQPPLDDRAEQIERAIGALIVLIRRRYPGASFEAQRAEDDPELVQPLARVDVEDTEDVADLVMDRMIEMQVVEGLPI